MAENSEVILVHGLWYGAWVMRRQGEKLQGMGFTIRHFEYAATTDSLEKHAIDLHRFASSVNVEQQHFLGHSLGGLLILRMLAAFDDIAPGRVVLLGSPLGGSSVSRKLANLPGSSKLLGQVKSTLAKGYSELPAERDIGMIAGSRPLGLGILAGGVGGPGDGTVGLHETQASGLKERLVLPVTHTGLLYSAEVARQAGAFLNRGHFEADGMPD